MAEPEATPPILLDTMVLTYLTDPRNPRPEWDPLVQGRTPVLSFVTVGEILHATRTSGWGKAQIAAVEARLQTYTVIPGTIGVARKYAELRSRFWKQVGENDLWVAACVLSQPTPLSLATEDGDFNKISEVFTRLILSVHPPQRPCSGAVSVG